MMRTFKKVIVYALIIFIILMIWLSASWLMPLGEKKEYSVSVANGDSVSVMVDKFIKAGIAVNKKLFIALVRAKKIDNKIKAGEYTFIGPISLWQLTDLLGDRNSSEARITIIEGLSAKQIGDYLQAQGLVNSSAFLAYVNNPPFAVRAKYNFLPKDKGLEGFLFPDTYNVYKTASVEDLVDMMLANFVKRVQPEYNNVLPKNFFDQLILASIVQDEVAGNQNMANVAGVFYKRLQKNMALQSDATINYFTGKKLTQPTIADTKINNPYNTYKFYGLPPGPISNPGLAAIRAVIKPADNPYYYFLTTGDGRVIYSKTYDEHLLNKKKYLK